MSSSHSPEPNTNAALWSLTVGWSIMGVRDALRSGEQGAIDKEVTPFYEKCIVPLARFAHVLLEQTQFVGKDIPQDGEDLAVEAFHKVCRLIATRNGDRIRNEIHLVRILFRAVRCVWIDSIRQPQVPIRQTYLDIESIVSPPGKDESRDHEGIFGSGKMAIVALQLLFQDGERFGRLLKRSKVAERHFRNYQALALYEIGERYRADLLETPVDFQQAIARYWRHFTQNVIGLRESDWIVLELSVQESLSQPRDVQTNLYEPLRRGIVEITNADLQSRQKRYVLRHDMGRFLSLCHTELERLEFL